ncbi:MAG: hypothetical protein ACN4GZ_08085 [Acidimicrobiales bacterium]
MFNIGGQEFALIIVLALVVVGPEQLPGLIRKLGQYAAQAREMSSSLRDEFMSATEPMQDTFKEFQDGMNEFQSGMTDLTKTVTEAADVNQWGAGTPEDPIVPRGFSEGQAASSEEHAVGTSTDSGDAVRPDPWAADRVQPITEPTRPKKLEVTPPVNPWDPIYQPGDAAGGPDVAPEPAGEPENLSGTGVHAQSEAAARQLESNQTSAASREVANPGDNADEKPA